MGNNEFDFKDFLPEDDADSKMDIEKAIDNLPLREKQILYLYVCEHTQAEIGVIVGLSQRHIGRILEKMSKKGA